MTEEPEPVDIAPLALAAAIAISIAALAGHGWTNGDVGLGLFDAKYCGSGDHCETWSWTRMEVAERLTGIGVACGVIGGISVLVLVVAWIATIRRRVTDGIVVVVHVAMIAAAIASVAFVLFSRNAFNHPPPLGWAIFGIFAALGLSSFGIKRGRARS